MISNYENSLKMWGWGYDNKDSLFIPNFVGDFNEYIQRLIEIGNEKIIEYRHRLRERQLKYLLDTN